MLNFNQSHRKINNEPKSLILSIIFLYEHFFFEGSSMNICQLTIIQNIFPNYFNIMKQEINNYFSYYHVHIISTQY